MGKSVFSRKGPTTIPLPPDEQPLGLRIALAPCYYGVSAADGRLPHTPLSLPVPMDVRLEVVHDKSRVSDVPLRRDTVVGRGKECQLRIPVADVSRRHCQFTLDGERLLIRDLGSSNGTQLADRTIPTGKDVLLSDGDAVTVGPVQFIVHITTTADPPEVAPSPTLESTTDLDDTAEFPSFEEMAEEVTDYVIDTQAEASPSVPDLSLIHI